MSFSKPIGDVYITPEVLKAEVDRQFTETNFDLRLGREQVRIPQMLTYRNLSISGATGTGKVQPIKSLLQQLRAMSNQKLTCLPEISRTYQISKPI